ncbi:MAG: 3-dehydroquinate synthase [Tissierellales bacterium]|jgi:3-dehydroquinate synthase|nr:3-dehydroquinate synthase [Tissierellales bacterium]
MEYLKVNCDSGKYDVYVGHGNRRQLNEILENEYLERRILIVTDNEIAKIYLDEVIEILKEHEVNYAIIPAGEKSKSIETMKYIYEKLLENDYGRKSLILSLGGGVVADIAGFVSSTYMRGIPYIQVPTTIISQVDSSIGGKVSINFNEYKNISGAYYHPKSVIIDIEFLKTLSDREYYSGISEIIKHSLIEDYEFFRELVDNKELIIGRDLKYMEKILIKSLNIKKTIVEMDERDYGIRRILNFGHSIGHGLESIGLFEKYTHGESIALGIIYETLLSFEMGLIKEAYCKEILDSLLWIVKPERYKDEDIALFYRVLEKDKNKLGKDMMFILPTERGRVGIFKNIERAKITKLLKNGHPFLDI